MNSRERLVLRLTIFISGGAFVVGLGGAVLVGGFGWGIPISMSIGVFLVLLMFRLILWTEGANDE